MAMNVTRGKRKGGERILAINVIILCAMAINVTGESLL
jgi:hypothetical protein